MTSLLGRLNLKLVPHVKSAAGTSHQKQHFNESYFTYSRLHFSCFINKLTFPYKIKIGWAAADFRINGCLISYKSPISLCTFSSSSLNIIWISIITIPTDLKHTVLWFPLYFSLKMQQQQQSGTYKWCANVFSKCGEIAKLHLSIAISLLLAQIYFYICGLLKICIMLLTHFLGYISISDYLKYSHLKWVTKQPNMPPLWKSGNRLNQGNSFKSLSS